jgi:cytochrome P450
MTSTATTGHISYNPFVRIEEAELYPLCARLREHPGLVRTDNGWWVVPRFTEVRQVLSHPEIFSSAPNQDELAGLSTQLDPDTDPEHLQRLMAIMADMPVDVGELISGRMIIGADPPTHTRLRSIVNRGFTPRRIEALASTVERLVEEALAGIEDAETFDVVSELAADLPARVLATMLGVSDIHATDMKRWAHTLSTTVQGTSRGSADEVQLALVSMLKEFADFIAPIVDDRRRKPGGDLISALVRAAEAETLTVVETIMFIFVLIFAGSETAANLITNTVVALYENPDQMELLLARPELAAGAIEESLRYRAPFQFFFRQALIDTELAGQRITEGEIVVVQVASANRDERVFTDPERFDITRDAPHLSLGHGIHFCLGAHLGRMEARIALTKLLPHLTRRRLLSAPCERIDTAFVYGYKSAELVRHDS